LRRLFFISLADVFPALRGILLRVRVYPKDRCDAMRAGARRETLANQNTAGAPLCGYADCKVVEGSLFMCFRGFT